MRKIFLRTFCLVFVLTLCLPMVACDLSNMQFGGLVGELMADNAKDDTPGELENDLVIEDVLPDIQTAGGLLYRGLHLSRNRRAVC